MPYLVRKYNLGFEAFNQARGYLRFKGEAPDQIEEAPELPEGFEWRPLKAKDSKPAHSRPPAQQPVEQPQPASAIQQPVPAQPVVQQQAQPVVVADDDVQAQKLERILAGFSVRSDEIKKIIRGFKEMSKFRERPDELWKWLINNISEKRLHQYANLFVEEVFGNPYEDVQMTPFGPYRSPQPYGPQYPPQMPQYTPFGQQPAWPAPNYGSPYPQQPWPQYPQPVKQEEDPKVKELQAQLSKMAEERERDREEARREKERRDMEDRFRQEREDRKEDIARLEATLKEIRDGLNGSGKKDDRMDAVLASLKEMKENETRDYIGSLASQVGKLLETVKAQPQNGRTMEDLVHELGPLAVDKVSAAGQDVIGELRELRQQIVPTSLTPTLPGAQQEPEDIATSASELRAAAEAEQRLMAAERAAIRATGESGEVQQ